MSGKNTLIVLLAAVLLLGVGASTILYYGWNLYEYKEVAYSFTLVEEEVGLLVENSSLAFGNAAPGSRATKYVALITAEHTRVVIRMTGDGVSYVVPEAYELFLEPKEERVVAFTLSTPKNASLGSYNGTAQFYFYRR